MKLALILTVLLTGCAQPPRLLADMYNRNDLCQNYYNQANYQYPQWCGAGSGAKYVTRTAGSNRPLTTTGVEK